MSKILELREKRAKAWEAAKAFLDAKRTQEGFVSAEDAATYDKMENDVVNLGKEIERLERQAAIDAELSKATSTPITNKPDAKTGGDTKTGRATDEYRKYKARTLSEVEQDYLDSIKLLEQKTDNKQG